MRRDLRIAHAYGVSQFCMRNAATFLCLRLARTDSDGDACLSMATRVLLKNNDMHQLVPSCTLSYYFRNDSRVVKRLLCISVVFQHAFPTVCSHPLLFVHPFHLRLGTLVCSAQVKSTELLLTFV